MTVLPGLSPRSSLVIAITRRRHSARNTCIVRGRFGRARTCPRPQSLTASLVRSTPPGGCTSSSSVDCFKLNVLAVFVDAGFDPVPRCLSDRRCFVRCTERLARPLRPAGGRASRACRRRCLQASRSARRRASHVTRIAVSSGACLLGELRGNRDLLPGRDDRTNVAVVVLFGG